ncbi:hypothetical protein ACWEQ8_44195, partial [Streptomyces noursei]
CGLPYVVAVNHFEGTERYDVEDVRDALTVPEHHRVTWTASPKLFASYWIFNGYISTLFRDGGVPMAYFFGFSFVAVYILVTAGKIRMARIQAPAANTGSVRSGTVGSVA